MKEKYESTEMEVVEINAEDVIVTSGNDKTDEFDGYR